MSFKQLLDELDKDIEATTLAKSMKADEGADAGDDGDDDDAAIAAAAAEGGEGGGGADAGEADDDKGEQDMAKALGLKATKVSVDGKEVEAFDGTALVKSLLTQNQKLVGQVTETEAAMKSLIGLNQKLAKQVSQLAKSVDAMANQGRGRKSATVVVPEGDKPKDQAIKPAEFMAKCMDLNKAGKLGANEVAEANAFIGRGLPPPDHIVTKVMSA